MPLPTARADGPRATPAASARRRSAVGALLVAPSTLVIAVFFLLPLALAVWMSFHDWPLFGEPAFTGLDNYEKALTDAQVWDALGFTTLYTVIATVAIFAVAFGLAFLVRSERPGVGLFRTALFLPVVVGMAASALLWSALYSPQGGAIPQLLSDLHLVTDPGSPFTAYWPALVAVIVMVVWKTAGLTMVLLVVGMQSIPADVYEAAALDGAGRVTVFRRITLPLMRRTLALAVVLSVTGSYLAFDQFYILTHGGPGLSTMTVVSTIYRTAFVSYQLGYAAAIAVLLLLLLAVLNAVQLRILRPGDR
ncbi:carbohydrate ABC transporter permease [Streptomyces sp. NPDC060194]|uniref:carbohydrate ABC transporter permease n=1 Tax=Streptomyces sp. NPDC060194 TaxID=3347069 RepID=UPI00365BEBD8